MPDTGGGSLTTLIAQLIATLKTEYRPGKRPLRKADYEAISRLIKRQRVVLRSARAKRRATITLDYSVRPKPDRRSTHDESFPSQDDRR